MATKIKTLQNKLTKLVHKHIKIRDNYICQWCGVHVEGSNAHPSHVIPKSEGNVLRWEPLNIKTLCFHCHINKWHKNPNDAADWFQEKFPERWEYLQKHRRDIVKWKAHDYEEMIEEAKTWLE